MKSKILNRYLGLFERELFQNVLPFWIKYSPDKKYGGYFSCLDRGGRVYDDKKYMWLQARQVWTFSKLYNTAGKNEKWLQIAKCGVEFIRKHGKRRDGRVYFSLTRAGKPYFLQRKIFAECFYIMGLSEYSKATGDIPMYNEALRLFWKVYEWSKDSSRVGRARLPGQENMSSLAVPMILLNLINEIERENNGKEFQGIKEDCVRRIKLHVRPELKLVLENVNADGRVINSPEGRLVNPGHAIEAGWFLLQYALKNDDRELAEISRNMIDWSFDFGWDKKFGGIYYFLDSQGFSPFQLEWQMKLWWPHLEAMYAFLLLYSVTNETGYLDKFIKVTDYSFGHFSDPKYGEWFGYLDRQGKRTHDIKGNNYKGCFHLPRALLFAIQLLKKLIAQ